MAEHAPYTLTLKGVTTRTIVRCDCGCGLFEEYQSPAQAHERADDEDDD